jgi:hypothetical protein
MGKDAGDATVGGGTMLLVVWPKVLPPAAGDATVGGLSCYHDGETLLPCVCNVGTGGRRHFLPSVYGIPANGEQPCYHGVCNVTTRGGRR